MVVTTDTSSGSMTECLLSIREVSVAVGVDPQTVRRWAKLGQLQVIDLAAHGSRGNYRVSRRELERFLAERTRGGEAA